MTTPSTFEPFPAPRPPGRSHPPEAGCGTHRHPCAGAADDSAHESPPDDVVSPQRPLRDGELRRLARQSRAALLQVDIDLRTAPMRQVFRRDFVHVSRLLHALEASRRVQGLDRAHLNDALAALQHRADAVQALLERLQHDLQARMATRAPSDATIAFARPSRFRATVLGPTARRYLALLLHADAMLAQLERAWLLGVVDPATRTALTADCRRALRGYKDLACKRRADMGDHVREINARRRRDDGSGSDE